MQTKTDHSLTEQGPVAEAKKFTFDTYFDAAGNEVRASAEPEHTLTETALEAVRAEARAEGRAAALTDLEQEHLGQVQALRQEIAGLSAQLGQEIENLKGSYTKLAFILAKTLSAEALARFPHAEIEALIHDVVAQTPLDQKLLVEVAPDQEKSVVELFADDPMIPDDLIKVRGTADLGPYDARAKWHAGGLERICKRIEEDIRQQIENRFPGLGALPEPPFEEGEENEDGQESPDAASTGASTETMRPKHVGE